MQHKRYKAPIYSLTLAGDGLMGKVNATPLN